VLVVSILFVLAGCTAGVSPTGSPTTDTGEQSLARGATVTITHVTDGDTMDVRFSDGREETVRLLGVDTPEVHTETAPSEWEGIPDTDAGAAWLRNWGENASRFATTELEGETVQIRTDPQADRRGSYGRLLVYLSLSSSSGDRSFNYRLIERGYARLYDTDFSRRDEFVAAERRARDEGTGAWGFAGASQVTATEALADGGQSVPLELVRIHADAAGNDNENLNDEYLVFENTGTETLDLSGWTIADEAGHTYTIPEGVTLAPGEQLTLFSGSGTNTQTELFWGADGALWNNGGDTVIVSTATGTVVLRESY
jgi:micrococcal nuclease